MDLQKHGSDITHVLDSDITHILDSKSTTKEDDWTRRGKPFVSEIKDHCFFFPTSFVMYSSELFIQSKYT